MIDSTTIVKGTMVATQGAMATKSILENPSVQNAIIQIVVVILTALLGRFGKNNK